MAEDTSNLDNDSAVQERYERFAKRLRDDAELRARIESGDADGALRALGLEAPAGVELCVAVDTDKVVHIAFPPDPNADLRDEELTWAVGGTGGGCWRYDDDAGRMVPACEPRYLLCHCTGA